MRARYCSIALLAAVGTTHAGAQIHEGDIAVGVNDGVLTIGTATDGMGTITEQQCVFGVELESQARTTDPGFDSDTGTFDSGTELAYFIGAALRKWDGSDFDTIPPEKVRISFGPAPGISTPDTDPAMPLEGIFVGTSNGEWHTHYAFRLELDGSPATGAASDGVYLLQLELQANTASYAPSEPFWLVVSEGASMTEFDEAYAFAEAAFGCPGTVCLADVNGDGSVTPADFSAWVAAFNAMSPACDQNGDGACSPADFSAWVSNFNAGC